MANIHVIGSGFSGLATAAYLAKSGHQVTVFEKNATPGGRCRQFEVDGFVFDMGPSWYWMPEVFENFFQDFGHTVADFYQLDRLNPSYVVHFGEKECVSISADLDKLKATFDSIEPGSGQKLEAFLADAAKKYEAGMDRFVHKPSLSIFEFADIEIAKGLLQLDLLKSFTKHVRKYFKNPKLIQLMEFPVLFLGATPAEIPALYSLMNYADIVGGTWYPQKGMYEIIKAMVAVCEEQGVEFKYNAPVDQIVINEATREANGVRVNGVDIPTDFVVASADYHHVDRDLIPARFSNYSEKYWDKRKMAPSALIYYIGLDKKLTGIQHHNLFFDTDFGKHAAEIYTTPQWPEDPLFYICAPSVTDVTVAPAGKENLFLLIPLAPGLTDSEEAREATFVKAMKRMEHLTGQEILPHVCYKKSFAMNDFQQDYNAYKGNAYGLANTLRQTAFLKPKIRNKNIQNLYYTGQLTTPGPGVPPSLISGKVVADYLNSKLSLAHA